MQHFYSSSLNKDDTKNDSFHVSVSARSQVQPVGVLFLLDEHVSTHFQLLADKRLQRRHPTHAVCVRVSSPARVIKAAKLWNCRHILVMKSSAPSSSICSQLHWQWTVHHCTEMWGWGGVYRPQTAKVQGRKALQCMQCIIKSL